MKPETIFEKYINSPSRVAVDGLEICPVLAETILANHNKKNRYLSEHRAQQFATDYKLGNWHAEAGHRILFDRDGQLISGQHRCRMVCIINEPVKFDVLFGLDPNIRMVDDTGKSKTVSDVLAAMGKDSDPKVGGIIKQVIYGMAGGRDRISPAAAIDYYDKMKEGIKFVLNAVSQESKKAKISYAPILGAAVRAYYYCPNDRAKLREFLEVLATGQSSNPAHYGINSFRDFVRSSASSRTAADVGIQYQKAEAAIAAWFEGADVATAKRRSYELFPVAWMSKPASATPIRYYFMPLSKSTIRDDVQLQSVVANGNFSVKKGDPMGKKITRGDKIIIGTKDEGVLAEVTVLNKQFHPRFKNDRYPIKIDVRGNHFGSPKPFTRGMMKIFTENKRISIEQVARQIPEVEYKEQVL